MRRAISGCRGRARSDKTDALKTIHVELSACAPASSGNLPLSEPLWVMSLVVWSRAARAAVVPPPGHLAVLSVVPEATSQRRVLRHFTRWSAGAIGVRPSAHSCSRHLASRFCAGLREPRHGRVRAGLRARVAARADPDRRGGEGVTRHPAVFLAWTSVGHEQLVYPDLADSATGSPIESAQATRQRRMDSLGPSGRDEVRALSTRTTAAPPRLTQPGGACRFRSARRPSEA